MTITEIAAMPVTIKEIPPGCRGVHESCVRSYQILELVKRWLAGGAPAQILLEVIESLENGVFQGEAS